MDKSNETKFWLNILDDGNLVPKELISECQWLFQETKELANIFASSILTMKSRE